MYYECHLWNLKMELPPHNLENKFLSRLVRRGEWNIPKGMIL